MLEKEQAPGAVHLAPLGCWLAPVGLWSSAADPFDVLGAADEARWREPSVLTTDLLLLGRSHHFLLFFSI